MFPIFFPRRKTRRRRHSRDRRSWTVPRVENLENRLLLATITWANEGTTGSDSDGFQAVYGSNTTTARDIVNRAISDSEAVVENFNYAGGGNTYSLTVQAADLNPTGPDTGRGSTGGINFDSVGTPVSATITLDDAGGSAGTAASAMTYSMVARATTCSLVGPGTTCCEAAPAATRCQAGPAGIGSSVERAATACRAAREMICSAAVEATIHSSAERAGINCSEAAEPTH